MAAIGEQILPWLPIERLAVAKRPAAEPRSASESRQASEPRPTAAPSRTEPDEAVPDLTTLSLLHETLDARINTLVQDHSSLLYRVAFSVLRNPAEAEDVVQDALLRVLQHRSSLAGILELRPWLARIAFNLALDRRRRRRADQMDDLFARSLVSSEIPADLALAEAAHTARVLAAIDCLPEKERQVLLLSAADELSAAEIAAILSRTESSVRSVLFRARTRLRQRLKDIAPKSPPRTP